MSELISITSIKIILTFALLQAISFLIGVLKILIVESGVWPDSNLLIGFVLMVFILTPVVTSLISFRLMHFDDLFKKVVFSLFILFLTSIISYLNLLWVAVEVNYWLTGEY